jgi:hypothetical protein
MKTVQMILSTNLATNPSDREIDENPAPSPITIEICDEMTPT